MSQQGQERYKNERKKEFILHAFGNRLNVGFSTGSSIRRQRNDSNN